MTNKEKLLALLRDNLRMRTEGGDFTDPNKRTIILEFDGEEVARTNFNVVQRREYEG